MIGLDLIGLAILAALILNALLLLRLLAKQSGVSLWAPPGTKRITVGAVGGGSGGITFNAQDSEEPEEPEAQAIDPENPPYYAHYRTVGYVAATAPKCSCHQRIIKPGERILLWPIPNEPTGGVDVFCSETFGVTG